MVDMTGIDIKNALPLTPEIVLLISSFVILILGLRYKKNIGYIAIISLLISLITLMQMMALLKIPYIYLPSSGLYYGGMFKIDAFSMFFKLVFISVAILVCIASVGFFRDLGYQGEYYSMILFSTTGMMIVASAEDLFAIFVGMEISSIATFALVAFRKKEKIESEAGMKFFIIGAFSSAIFLYGISIIYGVTETTNISQIYNTLISNSIYTPTLFLGIILIIAGIGFKMAIVPFHAWLPDTFEGAPTPITAFLASGSKKMAFAAGFKIFIVGLIALKVDWSIAIGILSIITMTLGNVIAISQKSVKRMLAYSTIAQAGYILIAIAVGTKLSIAGGMLHILTHAFMTAGAFFVVAIVARALTSENIEQYAGLKNRAPVTAFAMSLFLLSLAGLPPLGGFVSKFVLFASAIQAGGWVVSLAIAGVLNSALSLYYYARVIKYMYILPPTRNERISENPEILFALLIAVLFIILIGIYPAPFLSMAMIGAGSLGV